MTNAALERVDAITVAEAVRADNKEIAVVDVRNSEEFSSGHVKGALNLDSTSFSDNSLIDKLVDQLQSKSQVVVHCAKSLQRGPQSAAALKQRLQELGINKQVLVMDGGFEKFGELYGSDSSVVEGGAAPKLAAAAAAAAAAGVPSEEH
uniref:protein-tyrosine-phosphatase n=1 Tax=Tetradesmus obliquus TaxID=3088 RepID=A0A383W1W8_TETOB|eukprot:jgi/Sobl393_1/18403/SZX71668.1